MLRKFLEEKEFEVEKIIAQNERMVRALSESFDK
jgi:hypothetical protein